MEKLPPEGALRRPVLCARAPGPAGALDAVGTPSPRVSAAELQRRCQAEAALIAVAAPHLEWAHRALLPTAHAVVLVDCDGVVLQALATSDDLLDAADLQPGTDRSDDCCGTHGAGTALATGQAVAMLDRACARRRRDGATCVAAPIRGPDGRCVGAIELETPSGDGSPQQLVFVSHLAFAIEREIAARARPRVDPVPDGRAFALLYHDLRTPLSAILLRSSLLGHTVAPEARATASEHVRGIQTAVRSAERMLRNLHDLVALDAGTLRLRAAPRRLSESVDDTVDVVRPMADEGGIRLQVDVPRGLLVLVDPERAERVLANLLENAIRFTESGGTIDVRARRVGEEVEVVVRDTGVGIDAADLARVFERGWSGRGSTGLGLWIVHRLVEAHGGRVAVDSRPEGGTCVTFTLPAA